MSSRRHTAIVWGVVLLICAATASPARIEQNLPPEISHIPTVVAFRGQPIPVYAKVTDKTGRIKKVSLFYTLSQQVAPVEVPMKRTGRGRYSGTIPAGFFSASTKVWYYIEARDSYDDKGETTWFPVDIRDPDVEQVQEASDVVPSDTAATRTTSTRNPTGGDATTAGTAGSAGPAGRSVPAGAKTGTAASTGGGISAGTVIGAGVVAGGVAVGVAAASDSGGSSSGGGSGFDPANAVSVSANKSASGGFSAGPQDNVIDGSAAVAGKTVTGVRVTLNYEAYGIPDRFQIIYQGSTLADSGNVSGSGSIQGTGGGTSPQVTIRVLTPQGGTAWDWSAVVELSAN